MSSLLLLCAVLGTSPDGGRTVWESPAAARVIGDVPRSPPDGGSLEPPAANLLARPVDASRVERVLAGLTVRQRAAQLLLAYPQLDAVGPVEVGGILFVGELLRRPAVAKARIAASVARARIPPLVAVDVEGGPANRLKRVPGLAAMPSPLELARLDDAEVQAWGTRVGVAMRSLGLNMNLAPVLDVAASGHMRRHGRSFSGDAEVVVAKASAYARGLLEAGVVPIGKHYPGYGELDGDSDHALVIAEWPRERVWAHAEVFERARAVLGGVMIANVAYAAIDERPAIFAPALVARVHEQGWLSVTDDLSIGLLADAVSGTSADVLVAAFLAGNDLLLTTAPPDWSKGIDPVGVLTTLASTDETGRRRLDESCRRVLALKDRLGLLDGL